MCLMSHEMCDDLKSVMRHQAVTGQRPLSPNFAADDRECGGSLSIVIEQLRRPRRCPRNSGPPMCSKLVSEIKPAETLSERFLSNSGEI